MASGITNKDELLRFIRERDVKIINLWFVDILGMLKSFGITPHQLDEAIDEGLGFDGSSVEGFARIYESDLIAVPDLGTFELLPWKIGGQLHARMMCDVLNPDRRPYEGDPRNVLRRVLGRAKELGYTMNVGPELEYFYLKGHDDPSALDHAGEGVVDEIGGDAAQRAGAPGGQAAGDGVGLIAELVDGGLDARAGLTGDVVPVVDDAGDRLPGDTGHVGDVVDGDSSTPHWASW